jgi:hypothetical protein
MKSQNPEIPKSQNLKCSAKAVPVNGDSLLFFGAPKFMKPLSVGVFKKRNVLINMLLISLHREKLINYDLYRPTGPKLPVEKCHPISFR